MTYTAPDARLRGIICNNKSLKLPQGAGKWHRQLKRTLASSLNTDAVVRPTVAWGGCEHSKWYSAKTHMLSANVSTTPFKTW